MWAVFLVQICSWYRSGMSTAPVARKIPKEFVEHGTSRIDDYYWLREKQNPEVIAHLEAENAHTEEVMIDTKELQETLYEEMKGRMNENDTSAPYKHGDYFYYSRTEEGKQYPIFCRKHGSLGAPEQVLLDQNSVAKGHDFLSVPFLKISPDHTKLAYAVDFSGNEKHEVRVKNLVSGEHLSDIIGDVDHSLEWANDSSTFFYTVSDDTRRPYRVMRHVLGSEVSNDALIYEDLDERFFVGLSKSRSGKFISIELESKITSEVHVLNADNPYAAYRTINLRRQGHEYSIEHRGDQFLIVTNKDAKNFRLMSAPVETPSEEYWKEVIPHREEVMLEGVHAFKDFIVVNELERALRKLRVIRGEEDFHIPMPAQVYALGSAPNEEFDTDIVRFTYSSLATPTTTYDFDTASKELVLVKKKEVLGGFDEGEYEVERTLATAQDGTQIPISLVYRKGAKTGTNPLWLHGYGSYGLLQNPSFVESRISLLDRGFVFALAHIRGGGEGGRAWYEDGKFLKKANTFMDFIVCAEHLVAEGYGAKDKLTVSGRSAGGLLMGAVTNMRPDLFRTIVTAVPFVDVINTMMDPTIPLTVTEYEEWGNPNNLEYYAYMRSYSPYDNVTAQAYPHILVTAGLNDMRVQYWEPAKWVAKMREHKTDSNMLLLKTDMDSGHGGASGRYDALKETALEYAFALKALSVSD